jgi:putative addiction module component (TIGR02574 family)
MRRPRAREVSLSCGGKKLRDATYDRMIWFMDAVLPLDEMTAEEKLKALEAIWEALSRHEDQVPVPDWHKKVLDQRQRQIDSAEAKFISLEEMKERVRKRTG